MQPRKLDLFISTFSYAGNGGFASTHPAVMQWLMRLIPKVTADDRIGRVTHQDYVDTPITLTRNRAVVDARKAGYDLVLMVDSDMSVDCELGSDPYAKPFWDSSFDYLYEHWESGPVVIGAPYNGPPPLSNTYCFQWASWQNTDAAVNHDMRIEAYTREQAEVMSGIQECAALPTGLILFDIRAFDLVDPMKQLKRLLDQGVPAEYARLQVKPFFYYEFNDIYESEKASTEDVTATRDIAYMGQLELGYSPIKCNWDSWAAHVKPLLIKKPRSIKMDHVSAKYRAAVLAGHESTDRLAQFDFTRNGNGKVHA